MSAPEVYVGVEGLSDQGVASSIIRSCGLSVAGFYGMHGKSSLLKKLTAYNAAAMHAPWVVFVDLDNDGLCPGEKLNEWLPNPSSLMCFRIAVREMEAWLLADHEETARFLGVSRARIPESPEDLEDPKATLLSIARHSRKRAIREGLIPRPGSGQKVGPTYASDIREYGRTQWRPMVAAETAPSLQRCVSRIRQLAEIL